MTKFNTMKNSKLLLTTCVATAISTFAVNPVMAGEFQNGDWYGSFDTTISYGASWRADDYDPADVGKAWNNPAIAATGLIYSDEQRAALGRWSTNDDDGDLN